MSRSRILRESLTVYDGLRRVLIGRRFGEVIECFKSFLLSGGTISGVGFASESLPKHPRVTCVI